MGVAAVAEGGHPLVAPLRSRLLRNRSQQAAANFAADRQWRIGILPGAGVARTDKVGLLKPDGARRLALLLAGGTAGHKRAEANEGEKPSHGRSSAKKHLLS